MTQASTPSDISHRRYLNVTELSAYIGYSVHTIYGWVSQRRIPHVKKGGRLRFDREEIDRWMKEDAYEAIREER